MSSSTLYIDNIYNKAGTGGPNFSNGITTSSVNGGQLGGMRNLIINGNFDVWQRGTSFSASTSAIYTADRWFNQTSGGTVGTSLQEFTLGQTDVPNNPKYFLRHEVTVGNDNIRLVNKIEGVNTFSGQTITVSYWARHLSGTLPSGGIKAQLRQDFGTGGSPSSTVYVDSDNISLTSNWQKFTVTFDVPSISGKIIGTDGNDYLGVALLWQVGTDTTAYTIDLAQVQAEVGSTATPFEHRPYGTELALCQRYYQVQRGFLCGSYSGTTSFINFIPKVTMRANGPSGISISEHYSFDSRNAYGNGGTYLISDGTYGWNSGSVRNFSTDGWIFHGQNSTIPQGTICYAPGAVISFESEL